MGWILRLETLQTFDQSDIWTKRQKEEKIDIQKDKKRDKKVEKKEKDTPPSHDQKFLKSHFVRFKFPWLRW